MNRVHEPSWKVSSNWQQRQTEFAKAVLDLREVSAHGRIAREENISYGGLNHETAPQRAVDVAQAATREMFSRNTSYTYFVGYFGCAPPIKVDRVCYSMLFQ